MEIGAHDPRYGFSFMFPFEFFASLYKEKQQFWQRSVRGPVGAASRYWSNLESTKFVANHPALQGLDKSKLLPLGLHGDSGKFSHQEKLFVISWNSMLGEGTTKNTRYVITVIKNSMIGPGTLEALAKIIGWSFNVCLTGLTPGVDESGKSLPGGGSSYFAEGWRAVLRSIRGDGEFFNQVFGVPHWKCLERMCWLCGAVGDTNHACRYTRADPHAPWRRHRVTHETYLAECARLGVSPCAWFLEVLGLRIECLMIDVLHCVDLGVFAHLVAKIFCEVLSLNIWGTTQEANCLGLEAAMKAHYKKLKITNQFRGRLTIDRIKTSSDWPKLKGQGATVRSLGSFALCLAREYLQERHVLLCQLMVRFYEVLDTERLYLSTAARREIAEIGQVFCRTYNILSAEAFDAQLKLWKSSPKLHMFLHLCEWQAQDSNPRASWCYADEDLVGKLILIVQSCHRKTLPIITLWKWLSGVFEQEAAE